MAMRMFLCKWRWRPKEKSLKMIGRRTGSTEWFEIGDWLHWFLEKSRLKIEFQIQLPVHKRSW
jgi:hypothetical protein